MVEAKIINYKKALVEVDAVLSCLDYNEYKKIPTNIINAVSYTHLTLPTILRV